MRVLKWLKSEHFETNIYISNILVFLKKSHIQYIMAISHLC